MSAPNHLDSLRHAHLLPQGRPPPAPPSRVPRRVAALERADPLRRPDRCRLGRGAGAAGRDRHGALGARRSPRRGARAGSRRRAGPAAARHRPAPAGAAGRADLGRRAGLADAGVRREPLLAAHLRRRRLPAPRRHRSRPHLRRRSRHVPRGCRARSARRFARRLAPGAHRRPGRVRRRRADDGRDRLLPHGGAHDGARGRSARAADRDRAGACAVRPGAHRRGRRRRGTRDRRRGEPGALRHRRRVARRAPHRGAVPRVPAAAARDVRARGHAAALGVRRCHRPRRGAGRPLAAAARVPARRADGLGADPGSRRGPRVAALRFPRRAARDRVQPGLPARGRREHPRRDGRCSS